MASSININQNNNGITLQDNNRSISVTDNNSGTTVNVTQPVTNVVTVATPGPQGPIGPIPTSGSFTGSFSGSFIGNLTGTASNATSASYALTASYLTGYVSPFPYSGSAVITGSLTVSGSSTLTNIGPAIFSGSLIVTQGITGSLFGTSSYALTASYAMNGGSGGGGNFITTGSISASVSLGTGSFTVTSGSSTFMFISSSGNVGFGTTTPASKLDVNQSTIGITQIAKFGSSYQGNYAVVSVGDSYAASIAGYQNASTKRWEITNAGDIILNHPSSIPTISTAGQLRLSGGTTVAVTSGNFLIGTTTDAGYKLDVNGTARVSGTGNVFTINDSVNSRNFTFNPSYATSVYGGSIGHSTSHITLTANLGTDNNSSVGIFLGGPSGNRNASALFQMDTTTLGFLPPRMTLAQRIAISSPAVGLIVYETGSVTSEGLWLNETTGWQQLLTNSGSQSISGSLNVTSFTASNATISGNVTVLGTASINTLIVNQTQFTSGSNQLGDAADDFQTLYGTVDIKTGPVLVTGSLNVSSSATIQTLTIGLGAGSIAFNTALGFQALRVNTTGEANVGVGYRTFYNNTSGGYSVAVGYQSLYNNLGGNNNSAIGWYSLYNNTNGSGNTAIGLSSLQANTTGNSNTALGRQSLFTNTTGSNITAIGHSSLRSNLANNNTAVGYESAYSNTTGAQITAVGNAALRSNTLGSNNSAFGEGALYFNTIGNNNASLGAYSLFRNISGSNNTSIGDTSLGFTTSDNNVALGYLAGNSNTSGANNIFIGANSTGVSATDSNRTWIGNSSTTSTWLAGNILIGTTTDAGYKLDVNGTARVQGNTTISGDNIISGISSVNQLSFKLGVVSNQGVSTRNGDFTIGWSDATNILGGRFYNNGTGYLWIDGFTEGTSKSQNYPVIIGSRGSATGTSVGSYTTQENGSQTYFGYFNAQPSAQVIINSTTRGFLPPRTNLTSNISTPAQGLITYLTGSTNEGLYYYNSGSTPGWRQVADTTFVSASLSGSAGYVPVFTGANSVSSSVIFQSGSNIGIGTTTPISPLHINSSLVTQIRLNNGSNAVRIQLDGTSYGNIVNGSGQFYIDNDASGNKIILRGNAGTQINGGGTTSATTALLVQNANASASLAVLDNAYVGVGTSSPSYPFHVRNASAGVIATFGADSINSRLAVGYGMGAHLIEVGSWSGYGGIQNAVTNAPLVIQGTSGGNVLIGTTTNAGFKLDVAGTGRFTSNVGIGRTPTSSLDVAGTTRLSGSFNTAISGSILTVQGSGSAQPIFTVQGSQGELFSITDSLSGSLFSVNDISGLPILEVFSDNTTLIGNYQDPMLITTAKVVQTNSGSFTMYSLPTASYDTAFFEYSVRSGSNARAGTIMAIQSGSSVNFTETTTTDFGSTSAVSFTVIVTGSNMALTGSSTTGSWTIKTIVRGI
jgi:hypothetical protein